MNSISHTKIRKKIITLHKQADIKLIKNISLRTGDLYHY